MRDKTLQEEIQGLEEAWDELVWQIILAFRIKWICNKLVVFLTYLERKMR